MNKRTTPNDVPPLQGLNSMRPETQGFTLGYHMGALARAEEFRDE